VGSVARLVYLRRINKIIGFVMVSDAKAVNKRYAHVNDMLGIINEHGHGHFIKVMSDLIDAMGLEYNGYSTPLFFILMQKELSNKIAKKQQANIIK